MFSLPKRVLNNKFLYYAMMMFVLIAMFFCVGERGYVLWKDSPAYLACDGSTGIMSAYPLFLRFNQMIFGESLYLYAVVVEQGIFSIMCISIFTEFIRRKFKLSFLKMYPVLFFSVLMPFTVNMPLSISSHDVMTEALAYPFFYIYMICFIKTICDKKYSMVVVTIICSSLLAQLRTQLQLGAVLSAVAFFYVAWMRGRHLNTKKQLLRGGGLICLVVGVIVLGMAGTMVLNTLGQRVIAALNKADEKIGEGIEYETVGNKNMTQQYSHLIIDKAIYEIDEKDYLLFEDEEMQELCKKIFFAAEDSGERYVYMRDDLWAWQDIMDGIGSGTAIVATGWATYYAENPDTSLDYSAVNRIASVLFKEHFGRIILHTLQMVPQGMLCTVFFRQDSFYLICLIITFFIYLSAFGMIIWGYREKRVPNCYAEFLLGCLVINLIFVFALSILFFAMQRYLIYCFGIFWVAYYLMAMKVVEKYFIGDLRKDNEEN